MTDVIELDSDDEMLEDESSKNAGASINILNSVPLDLSAIFGSPASAGRPKTNGHAAARATHTSVRTAASQAVPRPGPHHSPYQRPLTATVRLAVNGSGGAAPQRYATTTGAIRSSTSVTHMTSYQPLARHSTQYGQQSRPLNGVQNGSMRGPTGQGEVMKMRLQMAHNGSYQRMPPRDFSPVAKPQHVVLGEEVSAERLKNYAFDTERDGASTRGIADGVMDCQRFRCTYGTCNALIFGNVNFMNHVWSHVAVWKITEEDVVEKGKTDVDALSTCPQCLARFEYPYQMQIHYTRAHSRLKQAVVGNTCAICEKEVTSLKHHLALHHPRDAPYRCPACTYKCNIRMHLYDHFARRHAHHTTLMCPFCSYFKTIEVPQSKHKKRYHIIKCREFINHMKKHESVTDKREVVSDVVMFNPVEAATNKRRIACDKCAQCFTKAEERVAHIKEMHTPLNPYYKCRARAMETRNRRGSELVLIAKGEHTICGECKKMKPEERNKKCATCARLLFSVDSLAGKSISYSDNVTRPTVRALAVAAVARGRCGCRFESSSGIVLAAHFCACRRRIRVQLKKKEEEEEKKEEKREPTKAEEKQQRDEMALFAIEDEDAVEVDMDRVREALKTLHAELEQEIVDRIRNRDAPPTPVVSKKGPKAWIPIKDPDAMDQLQERLNSIKVEPEAMTFRTRISRNDMVESEKKYKEIMAKREED